MRELYRLLWTLIKRKPQTAKQKAARQAAGRKAAQTRAANRKKNGAKSPAPRSGTAAKPKKAASPRPATQAA